MDFTKPVIPGESIDIVLPEIAVERLGREVIPLYNGSNLGPGGVGASGCQRGGGGGLKPPLSYEKRRRSPGLFGRRTPEREQIAVSSEQSAINAEEISAFMLIAVC